MLQAALSQIEVRDVLVTPPTLPESIALSTTEVLRWSVTLPGNEQWSILTGGILLVFDAPQLSVTGASCLLFTSGAVTGIPTALSFSNLVSTLLTRAVVVISLQGVEIPPGYTMDVDVFVANSDAIAAHNVTTASEGRILVRPFRVVSEIAVAQLVGQQTDVNLAARLRSPR
jgi:hypothetical protein